MRKNDKKTLVFAILTSCMLILTACGKSEEIAADETSSVQKSEAQETAIQENAIQENTLQGTTETVKTDIEDTTETENNENISAEKGVPWDDMSPVSIKDFPAGITGSVDENDVFFPDILFPSECTTGNGICSANLGDKDYSAYAYVETHARTIADGGELYFEQAAEEADADDESTEGEANDVPDGDDLLECDIIPCGMYDLDGNHFSKSLL